MHVKEKTKEKKYFIFLSKINFIIFFPSKIFSKKKRDYGAVHYFVKPLSIPNAK
jgi:hypothetical protein